MDFTPDLKVALDTILYKYTTDQLRGASFVVVDQDGNTLYENAVGSRTFGSTESNPLELDSVMWIASITKLFTSISCLIAIEQGLLTLETDACELIPEFADLPLLEGFEDSKTYPRVPILTRNEKPITLRNLLSHTSGLVYDQHHSGVQEWARYHDKTEHTFSGTYHGLYAPLVYPPGQGWVYSTGMDWAGKMIEIASGLSLEEFMHRNIFSKLAMNSTTFKRELRTDFDARTMSMSIRNRQTGNLMEGKVPLACPASDCSGGAGLYSTARDCGILLKALMANSGDILSPNSLDELYKPQLESNKYFLEVIRSHGKSHLGQTWPKNINGTFGLGSSICLEEFPCRRSANSCNWSGMPGLHCWIDRKTGIGAMLMTQILPPGDPHVTECLLELERTVYKHIRQPDV